MNLPLYIPEINVGVIFKKIRKFSRRRYLSLSFRKYDQKKIEIIC